MKDTEEIENDLPVPIPPARVSVSAKATFLHSLPPPPFFHILNIKSRQLQTD
jgi:hypothetical protein